MKEIKNVSKNKQEYVCLGYCSIAVRRHHDQGNSYKGKFNRGCLTVLEGQVSTLLSWWEAWQHPGRRGDVEGKKFSIS